jgi:CheY-like chemotaxis protein
MVRHLVARILEFQSYETAIAYSGEEAVRVACSFQPDCIVSDVTMGAMNGIEAAIEILGVLPQCKVLLISGGYRDLLENARAKGFDFEILAKPVPLRELRSFFRAQPTKPIYCAGTSSNKQCLARRASERYFGRHPEFRAWKSGVEHTLGDTAYPSRHLCSQYGANIFRMTEFDCSSIQCGYPRPIVRRGVGAYNTQIAKRAGQLAYFFHIH